MRIISEVLATRFGWLKTGNLFQTYLISNVVDIIQALLQQPDFQAARKYWNMLKERLTKESSQTVTNCHQLKMIAGDGKMRLTDVAEPINTTAAALPNKLDLNLKELRRKVYILPRRKNSKIYTSPYSHILMGTNLIS
jgi:hypothetical protein